MSYDLDLYFRSLEFPELDWLAILAWFDAIEKISHPEIYSPPDYEYQSWFIPVGKYGISCTLNQCELNYREEDEKSHWRIVIHTGSGFGLRQLFGYTLCYCVLTHIAETSAGDGGQYFHKLHQKPDKFLRQANAIITTHSLLQASEIRFMQRMGVMDENCHLIPDPQKLKQVAQSDLFDD